MNVADKIARLQQQIENVPQQRGDGKLVDWRIETATLLRLFLGEDNENYKKFGRVSYAPNVAPVSEESHVRAFNSGVKQAISLIRAAITELSVTAEMNVANTLTPGPGNEIFVVHGHAEALRLQVVDFIRKLTGAEPTVLSDQPNRGMTLFEKFEEAAGRACYAVVLATADDIGRAKSAEQENNRARQNVILEWGFFAGQLGRKRVALLYEEKVELPSDTTGLAYIEIDGAGGWRFQLAKELKAANIDVSLDRAI